MAPLALLIGTTLTSTVAGAAALSGFGSLLAGAAVSTIASKILSPKSVGAAPIGTPNEVSNPVKEEISAPKSNIPPSTTGQDNVGAKKIADVQRKKRAALSSRMRESGTRKTGGLGDVSQANVSSRKLSSVLG